jgi:hypothetical protein
LAARAEDLPDALVYVVSEPAARLAESQSPAGARTAEALWRVCVDHAGRACVACEGIGFVPVTVRCPSGALVLVVCDHADDPDSWCLVCELPDTNPDFVVRQTEVPV